MGASQICKLRIAFPGGPQRTRIIAPFDLRPEQLAISPVPFANAKLRSGGGPERAPEGSPG